MKYLVIKSIILLLLFIGCDTKKEKSDVINHSGIINYEYDFFKKYITLINNSKPESIPKFISICPREIKEHGSSKSIANHNYSYPYYSVFKEILTRSERKKVMDIRSTLLSKELFTENEKMVLLIIETELVNDSD